MKKNTHIFAIAGMLLCTGQSVIGCELSRETAERVLKEVAELHADKSKTFPQLLFRVADDAERDILDSSLVLANYVGDAAPQDGWGFNQAAVLVPVNEKTYEHMVRVLSYSVGSNHDETDKAEALDWLKRRVGRFTPLAHEHIKGFFDNDYYVK